MGYRPVVSKVVTVQKRRYPVPIRWILKILHDSKYLKHGNYGIIVF